MAYCLCLQFTQLPTSTSLISFCGFVLDTKLSPMRNAPYPKLRIDIMPQDSPPKRRLGTEAIVQRDLYW
jgi:hypothetical protein